MPAPADALFAWHERPGAFDRLVPPWAPVELASFEGIRDGQKAVLHLGPSPLHLTWVAEHEAYEPGRQFRDVQRQGPFHRWAHTHRMEPVDAGTSRLVDDLAFQLPLGALGERVGGGLIRRQLDRQFTYRHLTTATDLAVHRAINPIERRLRVAVSGASGVLGRMLCAFLSTGGHTVHRLVRTPSRAADAIYWSPENGAIEADKLEGLDAVIHLAGESIMGLRWTAAKKERIRQSRVRGTRLLAETLARLRRPPTAFLSASGVGIYGSRGDAMLDERAETTRDTFLAGVCQEWEAGTQPAEKAGIRTVHLRIGVVLTLRGGALPQLVRPFSLGFGVQAGRSADYLSWIAADDLIYAIGHLLMTPGIDGPVNLVGPAPTTYQELTAAVGRVVGRPVIGQVPPALIQAALGQMAEETLFQSLRLTPARLLETGFTFRHADLEPALRHQLGRYTPEEIPLETP